MTGCHYHQIRNHTSFNKAKELETAVSTKDKLAFAAIQD